MYITLVHNPNAGSQQPSKEKLLEALSSKGIEITYISSKESHFAESLLANLGDILIVAGGDGTVRKIAHLLLGKDVPIAVIPIGTANNISKTLAPPIRIASSIKEWRKLKTMRFDVGMVYYTGKEKCFVESIGCGALAEMIHRVDEEKESNQLTFSEPEKEIKFGRYIMEDMLRDYPACHYEIRVDDHLYAGKYLLVEVMNIKTIGPNLQLAPQAHPGDGWLDVALVQEHEKDTLRTYLSSLQQGEKHQPDFSVKRGKKISITTTCKKLHVDDELLPDEKPNTSEDTTHLDIRLENDFLNMFQHAFRLPS